METATPAATTTEAPGVTETPADPASTPTQTASPEPRPAQDEWGRYPLSTRTGVNAVDEVLEAMEQGDVRRLVALLTFQPFACGTEPDAALRCPDGAPAGTEFGVMYRGSCQPGFTVEFQREGVDESMRRLAAAEVEVLAVWRQPPGPADAPNFGEYGIAVVNIDLLDSFTGGRFEMLVLERGGIGGTQGPCGSSPLLFLDRAMDFVLPPRIP